MRQRHRDMRFPGAVATLWLSSELAWGDLHATAAVAAGLAAALTSGIRK